MAVLLCLVFKKTFCSNNKGLEHHFCRPSSHAVRPLELLRIFVDVLPALFVAVAASWLDEQAC